MTNWLKKLGELEGREFQLLMGLGLTLLIVTATSLCLLVISNVGNTLTQSRAETRQAIKETNRKVDNIAVVVSANEQLLKIMLDRLDRDLSERTLR